MLNNRARRLKRTIANRNQSNQSLEITRIIPGEKEHNYSLCNLSKSQNRFRFRKPAFKDVSRQELNSLRF